MFTFQTGSGIQTFSVAVDWIQWIPDADIHIHVVLYARLYLDTCVYHVIHQSTWDYYNCLFGVDGKLPNSLKKTYLSNFITFENIIFLPFFLFLHQMTLVPYLFLPCSEVCPPRVCRLFTFWLINSSLYHGIVNHVTVFSVFHRKEQSWIVWPSA